MGELMPVRDLLWQGSAAGRTREGRRSVRHTTVSSGTQIGETSVSLFFCPDFGRRWSGPDRPHHDMVACVLCCQTSHHIAWRGV